MARIDGISEETRALWRQQGLLKVCESCGEEYRPVTRYAGKTQRRCEKGCVANMRLKRLKENA